MFAKNKTTGALFNEEDLNDPRNLDYSKMSMSFGGSIPDEGDVIARPIHFYNQDRTSACTTQSTCGAIHQTEGGLLSPRYAYVRIKTDDKYPSSRLSYGAYMLDSVKLKIKEGIATLDVVPNSEANDEEKYKALKITPAIRESAKNNVGGSFLYPTTKKGSQEIFDAVIKYMWEQKRPVKIGLDWKQRWKEYRKTTHRTGIFPTRWVEGASSGHDIVAVAWKMIDEEPYLGCINSWGQWWGDKGMAWLPRNFTRFYSPIAYIPKIKEKDLKIEKDLDVEIVEKKPWAERANAQELNAFVDKKFPLDVEIEARTNNIVAHETYNRSKLMFIKSTTYLGWKFTDVINYLYAHSRGKTGEDAYNLNFKILRKEYFAK